MTLGSFLRRYGWAILIAGALSAVLLWTVSEPHYTTYFTAHHVRRALVLALGLLYFVGRAMLDLSPLLIVGVFALLAAVLLGLRFIWVQRRWPALIVALIAVVVNWLFIGGPGLVFSPYIPGQMPECEYLFDAQTTIKLIRYPVDDQLAYGEQMFFIVTNDRGESWRQIFEAYAIAPLFTECRNIQRDGSDGLIVYIERQIDVEFNELLTLVSEDRGRTWMLQDD